MADDKKTSSPDVSAPTEAPEQPDLAPDLSDTAAPTPLGPEELTVEEQLILEHEGQAALFEKGEAIPDAPEFPGVTIPEQSVPDKDDKQTASPGKDDPDPAPTGKVVDFAAAREEAGKTKPPAKEAAPPDKEAKKPEQHRRGRPPKGDKDKQSSKPRDKKSQSKPIIPDHHPALVEKAVFEKVQETQFRFSLPSKKKRDYPLKGKAFCGCCGHALSRSFNKNSYYYCRHSEADETSRCHKMKVNAKKLEQAVFTTLKNQIETAASINPDGTVRMETATPKKSEYEQQIEDLQDGKRLLYERYLMGEIDLDTYKAEKAACDELLLKTKNAYAAVLAQAKQKQEEQARQDNRKEAKKAIFDADTLTTELADLLIERVLVYPDSRIEVAYKFKDLFE